MRREDGSMGIKLRATAKVNGSQTTVFGVEPRGPAERAGVRRGHVVVEVNGECVLGWSHERVVAAMRTKPRHPIRLRLCPDGSFPAGAVAAALSEAASNDMPEPSAKDDRQPAAGHPAARKPVYGSSRLDATPLQASNVVVSQDQTPPDALKGSTGGRRLDFGAKDEESSFSDADLSSALASALRTVNQGAKSGDDAQTDPVKQLSDQVTGLLGIIKHLADSDGLTSKGKKILEITGLQDTIDSIVPHSKTDDSRTAQRSSRESDRLPSLGQRCGSGVAGSSNHDRDRKNTTSEPRHMNSNGNRAGALQWGRHNAGLGAQRKWPIDGRRSKLPKKTITAPAASNQVSGLQVVAMHSDSAADFSTNPRIVPSRKVTQRFQLPDFSTNRASSTNLNVNSTSALPTSMLDDSPPLLYANFTREFRYIKDEDFRLPDTIRVQQNSVRSWL